MSEAIEQLTKAIAPLESPANYFAGRGSGGIVPPRNVIFFPRRSKRELNFSLSAPHQHRRFVLIICLQTGGAVGLDGKWHRLEPGRAILIFPFEAHAMAPDRAHLEWLFITFDHDFPKALRELRGRVVDCPEQTLMRVRDMLKCWYEGEKSAPSLLLLTGLVIEELKQQAKRAPEAASPAPNGEGVLLGKVHNEVVERENLGVRVKDLAARLGISEPTLRASFRAECGISLGRYLRETRLMRAGRLLVTTQIPVSEIALSCGYESLYSFSRSFREGMGMPPSEYRREHSAAS